MCFNYKKLQGKIKEVCSTQDEFAKKIGIGRTSLSHRLNNRLDFTQGEINKAVEVLGIRKEEISTYFFNEEVRKGELIKKGA